MKQLAENPHAAISGEWFTAHGTGINLGYFGKAENIEIAQKLRHAFLNGLITDITILQIQIPVSFVSG